MRLPADFAILSSESSAFFHVITGVARQFLGLSIPESSAPGPFRFGRADRIEALCRHAGFARCRIDAVGMTVSCASVDEYVQVFRDIAWKSRLDALTSDALTEFKHAVADAARPYEVNGRLQLPAASWCAVADK